MVVGSSPIIHPTFSNPPKPGNTPYPPSPALSPEALFGRGLELAARARFEDALEVLGQALGRGYPAFECHYCLAGILKTLGRVTEAEFHARSSLALNPLFPPTYYLLARILKGSRPDKAIGLCRQALDLDPDCAVGHYDLACYLALGGRVEEALLSLGEACCKGEAMAAQAIRDPDLQVLREGGDTADRFSALLARYSF